MRKKNLLKRGVKPIYDYDTLERTGRLEIPTTPDKCFAKRNSAQCSAKKKGFNCHSQSTEDKLTVVLTLRHI